MIVIQTDLSYGDNARKFRTCFDNRLPVFAGILHLRRRDAYCVIHVLCRLEVVVDLFKVDEAVADADNSAYPGLFCLLAN